MKSLDIPFLFDGRLRLQVFYDIVYELEEHFHASRIVLGQVHISHGSIPYSLMVHGNQHRHGHCNLQA